jgi:tetratricopeptide (TPR) repeat protein
MKAIVDDWIARGDLKLNDGKCVVTVPFSELERHVPSNLSHLIENVIEGLPAELRHVLDIGSVAGESFSADEISAAAGMDSTTVESACESIADNIGFISREDIPWEPGMASAQYRFAHSLHREVLYSGVTMARRAEFHMAIGDSIEMLSDPSVPEIASKLADHYTRANNAEKAIKYLKMAAERSIERNAFSEAYDSLSTALQFVKRTPDDEGRKRIELALLQMFGNVAVTVSGWSAPEVEQSLLRAETLARDLKDDENLALVLYGLATMRELLGQYQASEELLNAQLEIVNSGLTMEAHELLACSTFHQGKFTETLDHAAKGLATYEPLKHHSPHMARYGENLGVSTNTWAALALWFVGKADEAIARSDLALEYARTQVYSLATAQIQRAFLHQFRLEPQECLKWAIATKETATEQGFPFRLVQAEILLQWALLASGESGADIDSLIEARNGYDRFGAALDTPYFDALVAEQEIRQSRTEDALERLETTLQRLRPSGTFFYEPEIMRFMAHGVKTLGNDDVSIVDRLTAAAERASEFGALPLELRATVDLHEVSTEPAHREALTVKLRNLLGRFETGLETPDLVSAKRLIGSGNTAGNA